MNLEYKHLLPQEFSPQSKVWIYQSSRMFLLSEALEIEELLNKFSSEWRSHGAEVDAYANLFFGQLSTTCPTTKTIFTTSFHFNQFGIQYFKHFSRCIIYIVCPSQITAIVVSDLFAFEIPTFFHPDFTFVDQLLK